MQCYDMAKVIGADTSWRTHRPPFCAPTPCRLLVEAVFFQTVFFQQQQQLPPTISRSINRDGGSSSSFSSSSSSSLIQADPRRAPANIWGKEEGNDRVKGHKYFELLDCSCFSSPPLFSTFTAPAAVSPSPYQFILHSFLLGKFFAGKRNNGTYSPVSWVRGCWEGGRVAGEIPLRYLKDY